jgi:NhaP-type Na+/H+ or K+/H+ antiporter
VTGFALFFVLVAVYSTVSAWLGQRSVTMPMIFVVAGLVLGSSGLGLLPLSPAEHQVQEVTEVTLAVLLFGDASTLKLGRVRRDAPLAARLLVVGLLLCVGLGGVVAFIVFPSAGWGVALLLGATLAPTDAALGLPIFTNSNVPARIRWELNVESGLNDGIVTPFVTLFTAVAVSEGAGGQHGWILSALGQIVVGSAVGIAVGVVGGTALTHASRRRLVSEEWEQLAVLAFALVAFVGSRALGGNGFIAAFVGGIVYGAVARTLPDRVTEYTQTTGTFLSVWVWTVFGAIFVPRAFNTDFTWRAIVYAVLSLTVVRMIPVAVALIGAGLRRDTVLLMGWFGPRGLASVVFFLTGYLALQDAGQSVDTLTAAATWTILLSVFAHGLSANPLAALYARRLQNADRDVPELQEAS